MNEQRNTPTINYRQYIFLEYGTRVLPPKKEEEPTIEDDLYAFLKDYQQEQKSNSKWDDDAKIGPDDLLELLEKDTEKQ